MVVTQSLVVLSEQHPLSALARRWERRTGLSTAARQRLLDLPHTVRALPRDAYIVREGDPTHECTLILDGLAYRQKLLSNGARQIISFHIPNEFVDLQNTGLKTADHNVQALTRTRVARVPQAALVAAMAEHPAIQKAVWIETLIDASIFREWVVNVGRRDALSRLAHLLCELALRLTRAGLAEGPCFQFPITQEQLADATGLSAVHTNRTIQSLRKAGLIGLSSHSLTILDWAGLAELGDFNERYLHHEA